MSLERKIIKACSYGDYKIFKRLVDRNLKQLTSCDFDAYLECAVYNNHYRIVKYLLNLGACANVCDYLGYTLLAIACTKGYIQVARLLRDYGGVLENEQEYSCMIEQACWLGYMDVIRFLVEIGEDLDRPNAYGNVAIFSATKKGNVEVVKYLVENGANINFKNSYNSTPLHMACLSNNMKLVKMLVENGAETDVKEHKNKQTPLYHACHRGNVKMAIYLLKNGARSNFKRGNKGDLAKLNNQQFHKVHRKMILHVDEIRRVIIDTMLINNDRMLSETILEFLFQPEWV